MRTVTLLLICSLFGCGSPIAPAPDRVAPRAVTALVHLPPTDFVSVPNFSPIAFGTDYFYGAGARGGNAQTTVAVVPGQYVSGFRAYLYGERTGLGEFDGRSIDMVLWRVGLGECPVVAPGHITNYCPVSWVDLIVGPNGWRDPDGWQIKENIRGQVIEPGFTYQIIANLSGVGQTLRVGWVEVDFSDTAPPVAPLLASDRALLRRVMF